MAREGGQRWGEGEGEVGLKVRGPCEWTPFLRFVTFRFESTNLPVVGLSSRFNFKILQPTNTRNLLLEYYPTRKLTTTTTTNTTNNVLPKQGH